MPSPCTPEAAKPVTIRRMRWYDVEAVAELDHVAFGPDTWSREFLWAQLAGPANRFWVAESGGLLGYAGLSLTGSESEILTIATAPAARGRGVAKQLLTTMLRAAREHHADAMYLDVRADNTSALGLYRSFGFTELGRRAGYYHDADAIIMRALLAD